MSLWSRIRSRVTEQSAGGATPSGGTEVSSGRTEDTGGVRDPSAPDRHSTTGTTPNETFVGRAAGDDPGYLVTGAEDRAAAEDGLRDDGRQ